MSKNNRLLDLSNTKYVKYMDLSIGDIKDEEMTKQDFRKAIMITTLSVVSSLIITIVLYLL